MAKARVGVFSGLGAKKSGVPSHAARTKPILSYEAKLLTLSVWGLTSYMSKTCPRTPNLLNQELNGSAFRSRNNIFFRLKYNTLDRFS